MFARWKSLKGVRGWYVWKLKLIDARLYFVSIFVGLLTGLVAVPYHYLLQFFFDTRRTFFDAHPRWYWHIPLFLALWGILIFVAWLVGKMPLITGGGIPQTRGVINGRISYKHPFIEMVSKFAGGVLALTAGLSLGREGPSVQIGSYVGCLVSKWTRVLSGERKQLLAAGAGAGLAAAFAAPLASSLLVIESIERFDAPKTAITTLLAGVVAGVHTNHNLFAEQEEEYTCSLTTIDRYEVMDKQVKESIGKIDIELAKEFFKSHERFPNCICSHPYPEKPWNKTLATMVFDLTEGEMYIAFGNACETPFNSYKFEHYYRK